MTLYFFTYFMIESENKVNDGKTTILSNSNFTPN